MFRCLFCLLCLFTGTLLAGEKPNLARLADTDFTKRKIAQEEIAGWATQFPTEAKEELLQKYLDSPEPEMRVRLIALLERAYFPTKGYVGVVMRADFLDHLGRIPRLQKGEAFVGVGVRIITVAPGTPAEASGIKVGDVILQINDWEVKGGVTITSSVAAQIQKHPPQTPISLKIRRGEEIIDLKVKLGILPVPSERARSLLASDDMKSGLLPAELAQQIREFRLWLTKKIEKDQENLMAGRR